MFKLRCRQRPASICWGRGQQRPAFARPAAPGTFAPGWRSLVEPGIQGQPAGQIAVLRQIQAGRSCRRRRWRRPRGKRLFLLALAEPLKHLHRQLPLGAIGQMLLLRRLLWHIEPEQNRQAEVALTAGGKLEDHAQAHPAVAPVHNRRPTRAQERIVMHADAEDFEATFACQRVVEAQQDRTVIQKGKHEGKEGQPPSSSSDQRAAEKRRW